jgi:hypothetical protein
LPFARRELFEDVGHFSLLRPQVQILAKLADRGISFYAPPVNTQVGVFLRNLLKIPRNPDEVNEINSMSRAF